MEYFNENDTGKVYSDFVQKELDKGNSVYVFPYIQMIEGELFKRGDDIQIYSQGDNKTEYFPGINDLSNQIDQERTILNVSILELNINGKPKEKNNMEWFFNGRKSPDEVRIVAQDCYYYDDDITVNERFKRRFNKVREIVPEREKVGIYEISTLPSERIDGNSNPAEFQAIVDWVSSLDEYNSKGALIIPSYFSVLDKDKIVIGVI